ncbi:MAG: ferredoxin family protein [Deltaproteobacteria bacterium]|jgi:ferredoxin like protein|nr:ferredoxin family protein [Deltaproteobacteria bacterium]
MQVEQKLSINKFVVDEGHPHIVIDQEKMDEAAVKALTMVCPAGLYTLDDNGRLIFEFAGCLECGTCRVAVQHKADCMEWNHPRPSFGVQYRYG